MTYSTQMLDIAGYHDEPVPNTFYRQNGKTQHLAILLPGIRYPCQAPLLFYPARLLGTSGADVCFVEHAYNRRPDFQSLLSPPYVLCRFGPLPDVSGVAAVFTGKRKEAVQARPRG